MASACAFAGAASAQTTPDNTGPPCAPAPNCAPAELNSGDRIDYQADFFSQFSPQNALDMVRQTPGFSLDEGGGRRGLSGSEGNVLIDGVRPSTKSQSLSDVLSRVPAGQVVRIEIWRGSLVAGDGAGHSVLLNVVRTPSAGGGVWEAGLEYGSRPVAAPRGEIAYSGRNGQFEYGLGATYRANYGAREGYWRRYNGVGALDERIGARYSSSSDEWSLSGDAAMQLGGGRLSLNAQVESETDTDRDGFAFVAPTGALLSDLFIEEVEEQDGFELGFTYLRPFGPWSLELVGLANRESRDSEEIGVRSDAAGAVTRISTQDVRRDEEETILRATLSRSFDTQSIEFGAEGAFNALDQAFRLARDEGAGPAPVLVPNANVLVEEERAEVFAAHAWAPQENWSIESRLAWETSTLDFTGDADQSVSLSFWKPSLQITRNLGEANQVNLRIYRDVGQLNFGDFVSAISLSDNLISGGNPDLQPETSWHIGLGADFRFDNGAALGLELRHTRYEDFNDLVLITAPGANPGDPPILFDAPGNIGDAEQTRLEVSLTTPLDPFFPGARIITSGVVRDHEVIDPVTGRRRVISDRPETNFDFDFRHDIASWRFAWGFTVSQNGETLTHRFNELGVREQDAWITAFVETTALPNDMRLRLTFWDVGRRSTDNSRVFYDPDRNGSPVRSEWRSTWADNAPWFLLELSGSF